MGLLGGAYQTGGSPYPSADPRQRGGMVTHGSKASPDPRRNDSAGYSSSQWSAYGGGAARYDSRPSVVGSNGLNFFQNIGLQGTVNQARNDAFNSLMGANAVQLGELASTANQARLQLQYQGALNGNAERAARADYDTNLANLNLNRMSNEVDRAAAARASGDIDAAYNLDYERYLRNWEYTQKARTLSEQAFLADLGWLDTQSNKLGADYQFAERGFDNQADDAAMDRDARAQQIREQMATGGGGFTQGIRFDTDMSNRAFASENEKISLGRARNKSDYDFGLAGIANDRAGLNNARDKANLNFERDFNLMNADLKQAGLTRDQQKAAARDRSAQLDIMAAKFGVDANALAANLNLTLEQMGLQHQLTVGKLFDVIATGNRQQQALVNSIAQQAGNAAKSKGAAVFAGMAKGNQKKK